MAERIMLNDEKTYPRHTKCTSTIDKIVEISQVTEIFKDCFVGCKMRVKLDLNDGEIYENALKNLNIAWIRKEMKKCKNVEEIEKKFEGKVLNISEFKPERKMKDPLEKAKSAIGKLTDEEKAEMIKLLSE